MLQSAMSARVCALGFQHGALVPLLYARVAAQHVRFSHSCRLEHGVKHGAAGAHRLGLALRPRRRRPRTAHAGCCPRRTPAQRQSARTCAARRTPPACHTSASCKTEGRRRHGDKVVVPVCYRTGKQGSMKSQSIFSREHVAARPKVSEKACNKPHSTGPHAQASAAAPASAADAAPGPSTAQGTPAGAPWDPVWPSAAAPQQ